jgi:hypothetical protein
VLKPLLETLRSPRTPKNPEALERSKGRSAEMPTVRKSSNSQILKSSPPKAEAKLNLKEGCNLAQNFNSASFVGDLSRNQLNRRQLQPLPSANSLETASFVDLCLNENLRSSLKLKNPLFAGFLIFFYSCVSPRFSNSASASTI